MGVRATTLRLALGLRGIGAIGAIGLVSSPAPALAYCQLTTEAPAMSTCPSPCQSAGEPVSWWNRSVAFSINDQFIPDLPPETAQRVIAESFAEWTQQSCTTRGINLSLVLNEAPTPITTVGHEDGEHVIIYRNAAEWSARGYSSRAFALTEVDFVEQTGEIVGADMELNGGLGQFADCPDVGCVPGAQVDLANVVTHEAGHVIGLAHSEVADSTMFCDAQPFEVNKRDLHPDDHQAVCDIYATDAPTPTPNPGAPSSGGGADDGGCTASGGSQTGSAYPALLLLLALVAVRTRRHRATD